MILNHPRGPRAKGEGEGEGKEKGKRTPWAFDYPKPFPTAKFNPIRDNITKISGTSHYRLDAMTVHVSKLSFLTMMLFTSYVKPHVVSEEFSIQEFLFQF